MRRLHRQPSNENEPAIDQEILVVDDEEHVLSVLQRLFESQYTVHTASSGEEALEVFRQHHEKIALILSDQRMPKMQGTEFLRRSMEIKRDCVRMILTGYTDVKDLIDSINSGGVFQYITKPFETEDLLLTVRRGVDYYVQRRELEEAHAELKQAYDQLKRTQEQLMQSEKMSMLGKLMGNIAHEIRNPITNIGNSVRLLDMDWRKVSETLTALAEGGNVPVESLLEQVGGRQAIADMADEIESSVRIIDNSCQLVTEIVEDLRGFSRLDNARFVFFDVHETIERALVLLNTRYKHSVRFHKEFSKIPPMEGLPGPVSQVMINLLNNAAQEVSDREGDVWISTREEGDMIRIAIRDNGPGIPPEIREKIFETGFTTKNENEGTGLGLTIVQEIVRRHGGTVECGASPEGGAEFVLKFPATQPVKSAENKEG